MGGFAQFGKWLGKARSGSAGSDGPRKQREIFINQHDQNAQFRYANNYIKTSKYNVLTFLPKNLFEQFQRLANVYFFVLMLLQWCPVISSLTPITTMMPLFFVLLLTAVKDLVDDVQRHRSDNKVNGRRSDVLRGGKFVQERWDKVVVGDIIRMEDGQFVAADLMLLSSSEPNGLVYIETAELDGETNLKPRQALVETEPLKDSNEKFADLKAQITCEAPNNNLSKFEGVLKLDDGKSLPITNNQILLRGCILRNTVWCYGVVVFAGKDTKLMQNSGKTKFKRTNIDKLLNKIIIGIVMFLFVLCFAGSIGCGFWEYTTGRKFQWVMPWEERVVGGYSEETAIAVTSILMFFSYVIMLNTLVPISLYVSVEIVRLCHSVLINWDHEMMHNGSSSQARTTTLTEQLGQIEYIFSDKTGTLTQNIMTFNKCSINGRRYGDVLDDQGEIVEPDEGTLLTDFSKNPLADPAFRFFDPKLLTDIENKDPDCDLFFRILSLCHTVMPDEKHGKLVYQAQSPDEGALVSAARNFGYVFLYRTPDKVRVQIGDDQLEFRLLEIIDFNNVRKRMSVILEKDGKIVLYCKGADSVIMERLAKTEENEQLAEVTNDHLEQFAGEGLRTLCLAWKEIPQDQFDSWRKKYEEAKLSMDDRDDKMDEVAEEIETDLNLIGATAIEDKLQDGVPDAIASLALADIKIWVLTGDKLETAINIGYSCRLLTEEMEEVFVIDAEEKEGVKQQLEKAYEELSHPDNAPVWNPSSNEVFQPRETIVRFEGADDKAEKNGGNRPRKKSGGDTLDDPKPTGKTYALVIQGKSLAFALEAELEEIFLKIACLCSAVICCRVTPLQKALVVELVKRRKQAITLAIGDGANDVSMIKAAHIGIGISGQEGMQAVLASDYSIGQFRFLKRLLLVHGRWSYYRMAKFLRYFFYKNFAFTLCHFWYDMFCGFSAQVAYDPLYITFYNLLYTATPIVGVAIFDQDVNDVNSIDFPKLYTPGHRNVLFNTWQFFKSVIHGFATSLVVFYATYGAMHYYVEDLHGMQAFQTALGTILFVTVTADVALDTAFWAWINYAFVFGSLLVYFAATMAIHQFPVLSAYYGTDLKVFLNPSFWFTLVLTVIVLTVPIVLARFYKLDVNPSLSDRIRMRQKNASRRQRTIQLVQRPSYLRRSSRLRGSRFKRSGYAFAHESGFGHLITSGLNMFGGNEGTKESGSVRLFSRFQKQRADTNSKFKQNFIIQDNPKAEMKEIGLPVTGDEVDAASRDESVRTTTF
ncbi:phospholipid-transporting ATPase ID-like [Paramacrobiotus metropolitanus]|uniref:phospholipid-transporting ATPase ID-like n=1 Tax=Paramacrobiotus metropolitanus TaxID=2943436 RepID=UPI002445C9F8|nr:phospholipid-transporting ATPase ID-like [Paramacrobiotus metropolitanus]